MVVDAPAGSSGTPTVLALALDTERTTLVYELWEDRRPALDRFVRHMSGAD